MKLASIDIGSNGARLLIKNFRQLGNGEELISRVMYMRVPLRLGADVFTLGKISKQRALMMKHMLKAFRQLMKLNLVDDYRACATSAMRDADNGKKILKNCARKRGSTSILSTERRRLFCFATTSSRTSALQLATTPISMWVAAVRRFPYCMMER